MRLFSRYGALLPLVALSWTGTPTASAEGFTRPFDSDLTAANLPDRFAPLNLPPHFARLIRNRAIIDAYLLHHSRVEAGPRPAPVDPRLIRARNPAGVRVLDWSLPAATTEFRAGLPQILAPSRGFRAPILEEAARWSIVLERTNQFTPPDFEASQLIHHRLAFDGLLFTLAQVIETLGPQSFQRSGTRGLLHLEALGFPADLLACFAKHPQDSPLNAAVGVMEELADEIASGATSESLRSRLERRPFRFPPAWSRFEVAPESGNEELGLLRLQIGGGFADGVVPGDSLHVVLQLITGLPHADALISVPEDILQPVEAWARQSFPVRRPGHVTLVSTPGRIESWAQDNGKAGVVRAIAPGSAATITPRYASRQEGLSYFLPSESFLTDGLSAAGLEVVHFPLLFQGGNLLAVHDPATGRRILLIGEGEVHRNLALGLSPEQILESFRQGFGVAACVQVPATSYHLDFDVSVRAMDGGLVAFVNDPPAATRSILGLGIDALERHSRLDPETANTLREDLNGPGALAANRLRRLLDDARQADGTYPASLATLFRSGSHDSTTGNLQVFLQALMLLDSETAAQPAVDADTDKARAVQAFREMAEARKTQQSALAAAGFKIVRVPSLPNFYRSINYLNGLHHQGGYVMPAYGGFYAPMDAAAERVFRQHLGTQASILRIQCAELQRKHGAVHCAAVAHPRRASEATAVPAVVGF